MYGRPLAVFNTKNNAMQVTDDVPEVKDSLDDVAGVVSCVGDGFVDEISDTDLNTLDLDQCSAEVAPCHHTVCVYSRVLITLQ